MHLFADAWAFSRLLALDAWLLLEYIQRWSKSSGRPGRSIVTWIELLKRPALKAGGESRDPSGGCSDLVPRLWPGVRLMSGARFSRAVGSMWSSY
jgi:hypothetical protein